MFYNGRKGVFNLLLVKQLPIPGQIKSSLLSSIPNVDTVNEMAQDYDPNVRIVHRRLRHGQQKTLCRRNRENCAIKKQM